MRAETMTLARRSFAQSSPKPTVAARTKLLLEGRIFPTLLRLSAPNILNLLAIAGMITFDGLFLGRLGADALAGVSLAFPFVMLMQHTAASGMGGGVASAVARALGAGRREVADALAFHAFVLALGLAAAFSTVLLLGAPFVFRWMGGRGEMLSAALAYADVAFSGAISICMLNLLASVVRGTGKMGLPAAVIVGSVIGHVLISPALASRPPVARSDRSSRSFPIRGCGFSPPIASSCAWARFICKLSGRVTVSMGSGWGSISQPKDSETSSRPSAPMRCAYSRARDADWPLCGSVSAQPDCSSPLRAASARTQP